MAGGRVERPRHRKAAAKKNRGRSLLCARLKAARESVISDCKTSSQPGLLVIINIDNFGGFAVAFNTLDGAGKNPWMAVEHRPLASGFEIN